MPRGRSKISFVGRAAAPVPVPPGTTVPVVHRGLSGCDSGGILRANPPRPYYTISGARAMRSGLA